MNERLYFIFLVHNQIPRLKLSVTSRFTAGYLNLNIIEQEVDI